MSEPFLHDVARRAPQARLLLAHGAGAPMDSEFMQRLAAALSERDVDVLRFEFPYMAERRATGRRRPPNPMATLQAHYRELIGSLDGPVFIGGKSMGGRVASMLAAEPGVAGVVCFGYPFHPPGRPERTRVEHLQDPEKPVLILQGTRDPFGRPEEVAGYELGESVKVFWLDSADHDFKPLKRSGQDQAQVIDEAAAVAARFMVAQRG